MARRLLSSISPMTLGLTAVATTAVGAGFITNNPKNNTITYANDLKTANANPLDTQSSPGSQNGKQNGQWGPKFGFMDLTLEESKMVNWNTKELKFRLPEGWKGGDGKGVVSSLLTIHKSPNAWFPTPRPYTPVSTTQTHTTLLVKHYPLGAASTHLHSLSPGSTLRAKTLPPEYVHKPQDNQKTLVMIAGGVGITPMYQLLNKVLQNKDDNTKVRLIYANTTEQDVLLKPELDDLAARYPTRFSTNYVLKETPATKDAEDKTSYKIGYVDKTTLKEVVGQEGQGRTKVLVCGPPAMMEAIAGKKGFGFLQGSLGGLLKEIGLEQGDVHKF